MSGEQLAEFFERRRGDTSHWSDVPVKAEVRRRGSVVFSVRFSPEELLLLRDRAQEAGTTISALIRSAAVEAAVWPSMVYTLTMDEQLRAVSGAPRVTVRSTFGWTEAAEPIHHPGQPLVEYVLGTKGSPRSDSVARLIPS
jgi:hypothetical protein